jgi:uncharacterized protein (TIGR03067 family)
MRWPCLLVPAVALLSGADAPKKPPADGDRIQGVWNLVSSERGGKAEAGDEKQPLQIEFTAESFRFRLPAGARRAQPYTLDPGKSPKAIDWLGDRKDVSPVPGIYELDGDTLKVCWGVGDKVRPREFKTKAGKDDWLWVLKRAKDD